MKRNKFYQEYYKITDSLYCDYTIRFAKDREKALRKGQLFTSKTERKIFIVFQYLILLFSILLLFVKYGQFSIIGFILFLLLYLITDFSIIKTEILFNIFNRNNIYANLLYLTFSGGVDSFLNLLKSNNKNISGFVRKNRNKLIAKYAVIYRKRQERAIIIFKPNSIVIKTAVSKHTFNDSNLSRNDLTEEISEILNT